jgi:hypothetical protein
VLLLLLLWLLVFDISDLRGRSLVEEFIQDVKSDSGGRHRTNFGLERVVHARSGNIVEDFFVLLTVPPSLAPISFQTIRIHSD